MDWEIPYPRSDTFDLNKKVDVLKIFLAVHNILLRYSVERYIHIYHMMLHVWE